MKELTKDNIVQIEAAIITLANTLNVDKDLIIRMLMNGSELNIHPAKRFDEMFDYLKREFHVPTEKVRSITANPLEFPLYSEPEIEIDEEDRGFITKKFVHNELRFDLVKLFPSFAFDKNKQYRIVIKEENKGNGRKF